MKGQTAETIRVEMKGARSGYRRVDAGQGHGHGGHSVCGGGGCGG